MRLRTTLAGLILLFAACSSEGSSGGGSDGYSGGTQPLALMPAPPGLCDGDGSQKDCSSDDGCVDEPGGPGGVGAPSGSGGGYGNSAGASNGGSGAGPSQGGSGAGPSQGGAGATAGSAGAGGATGGQPGDAGACTPDDDGGLPDGCEDGGSGSDPDAGTGSTPDAGPSPARRTSQAGNACSGLSHSLPATLYMSADDSASTASPVIARRMIRSGQRVPGFAVRPWEFLNYYDFSFQPAEAGGVRIVPQLSACPKDGELSLQIALQAEARAADDRRLLNITFVLDTSGSMSGQPIELEREAVLAIAGQLKQGDIVSMVTWSTEQQDILSGHVVSGADDPVVLAAGQGIEASGGTNLNAGLSRGYALAEKHHSADRINRLVLISDGQANVGVTDEELIAAHANDEEGEEGIYLSGIGVGDGLNDTLMNAVTDAGRGAYVYLDTPQEAQKMLGQRFLEVTDIAARSVRLEVTLPWYMQIQKFYGEVVSTDPTKVRPQHLGPNDNMLFFQVLESCDPSLIHGDDRIRLRATWERPFTRTKHEAVIDTTLNALAGDDSELTKAAAIAGWAEALIQSEAAPDRAQEFLTEALQNVAAARNSSSDPDLVEVAELITRALEIY